MASVKSLSLNSLWDKQDQSAVTFRYKTKSGEEIQIRSKADLDEEYETYLDEERLRLGIIKGDSSSYDDVHLAQLTRVGLLAITLPEDRGLWDEVENDRGPMGSQFMSTIEKQIQESIVGKKGEDPTGGQKRS